jgi:predicted DNA-binding protein (UPF0251 family)
MIRDALEAMRLADLDGYDHHQATKQMNVSRKTLSIEGHGCRRPDEALVTK